MNKYISLLFVVVLLSCQSGKKPEAVPEYVLRHERLFTDEPVIGNVRGMALLHDSIPVLTLAKSDKAFQWLDYPKQEARSYGDLGQGPDELLFPTSLVASVEGGIRFWDINKRRYSAMRLADGDTLPRFCHLFESSDSLFHFEVLPVTGDRFVAAGMYEDYRLVLLDGNGRFVKGFGQCPFRDEDERKVSNMIRSDAYQGKMALNGSGTELVHALLRADILSFYDLSGDGDIQLKAERINGYPDYQYTTGAMPLSSPICYLDVCATDRYVYALYSGRNYKDDKDRAFTGRMVKVYDWDGTLVRKLHLDADAKVFCVSSDDRRLYAIVHQPDPVLVLFTLGEGM